MSDRDLTSRENWPAIAPVDGASLSAHAVKNYERLCQERISPDVAISVAGDILADLSVAELFAQPDDELITAATALCSLTRGLARSLRDPESDAAITQRWRAAAFAIDCLVRSLARRTA